MPVSCSSNRIIASSIKNTERAAVGQFIPSTVINGLLDVWDEIPPNNFLNNCTRIWERDKAGVLFQGELFCLVLLYHMTSGPISAITRAWTPLGRYISLPLLVSRLDYSGLLTSMTHL